MQYLNGLEKFDMHFSKEIILGILLGMVSSAIIFRLFGKRYTHQEQQVL
jgi:hypothetical protein